MADTLRPLFDPVEVQAEASRVLGEHLGANRVVYFEIRGDEYVVERDYTAGVQPLAGRYPVAAFGPAVLAGLLEGHTVIEADATTEPDRPPGERSAFAAIQVRGHVDVPLVKGGRFVAGMAVQMSERRDWTRQEVALIEETAERTWAAVERVRAEREVIRLAAEADRERRLFAAVLSNTPDFIYTFDLQGRFVYVNAALLALWGKTLDEAVGRNFFDLGYPPALADRLQRQIQQVIDTKQHIRDDTPYTSALGERMYEYIFAPVIGTGEWSRPGRLDPEITDRKCRSERERPSIASRRGPRKDEFWRRWRTSSQRWPRPYRPAGDPQGGPTGHRAGASMMERQLGQRRHGTTCRVSRVTSGKRSFARRGSISGGHHDAVRRASPSSRPTPLPSSCAGNDRRDGDPMRLAQVVSKLLTTRPGTLTAVGTSGWK